MRYLMALILWAGIISFSSAQTSAPEQQEPKLDEDVSLNCFWLDSENIACFAEPEGESGDKNIEITPEGQPKVPQPGSPNEGATEGNEQWVPVPREEQEVPQKQQGDGKIKVLL